MVFQASDIIVELAVKYFVWVPCGEIQTAQENDQNAPLFCSGSGPV